MSDTCCGHDDPGADRDEGERGPEQLWQVSEIRAAALAGVLLLAGLIVGWAGGPRLVTLVAEAAALVVAGVTFVPSTLKRLVAGKIGVGTLMTIAAVGAVALGEVGEAAMLAFLFAISEGLEEYSITRTRRGLRALLSLVPAVATVRRGGREYRVAPTELAVGEVMVVKPGERIATDGVITAGRTALDTSAITGESVPIEAGPGDAVFAGSINGTGVLDVQITATATDNSLARIVAIVEAEQARKGSSQRLADRVARPLVPAVMVAAVIIAVVGSVVGDPRVWIERALVVLVAASPCALAIAVPVTVVAAIGAASKMGVLIKGGAALEARSEHPLAAAILAAADEVTPARDVESALGAGLSGWLDGSLVRLGRPGWIPPGPLADDIDRMQRAGATAVLVERDGAVLGAVAVRDELRPEAAEVIGGLRAHGYQVAMLTGDNERTARALAVDAGIDDVHADLRPEDKARIVEELRSRRPTAMVGDGVNDAPALATADLGIAMGAMGTDVAIETADVALMGQDLRHLPQVLSHARRSRRIMLQNIGLSLAIITILLPLALLGVLGLAAVVLVHELAEIVVIANGVRAGRTQPLADIPRPHGRRASTRRATAQIGNTANS